MSQVLTVPPIRGVRHRPSRWRFLPKLLFVLPAGVAILVVRNDWLTRSSGFALSTFNTYFGLVSDWAFLICVLLLTRECLRLSRETDRIWAEQEAKLG